MENSEISTKLVIEQAKLASGVTHVKLERGDENAVTFFAVPLANGDVKLVDPKPFLDAQRAYPERVTKSTSLDVLESFLVFVKRFVTAFTVLFTTIAKGPNGPEARTTAVFDYDDGRIPGDDGASFVDSPTVARHRQHRAQYTFPLSDAWAFWSKLSATLSQDALAELIEDHIEDVLDPAGAPEGTRMLLKELQIRPADRTALMALTRGLKMRIDSTFENRKNLDTGEVAIQWKEEIKGEDGAPLVVPNGFLLCIPAFREGRPYMIPCRLRFKNTNGKLVWTVVPYRMDIAFRDAVNDAVHVIIDAIQRPHYFGTPTAPES